MYGGLNVAQSMRSDSMEVQAGIPVGWIIYADSQALNGCNNEEVVPLLDGYAEKYNCGHKPMMTEDGQNAQSVFKNAADLRS